ncbi:MAG: prepilin-type N-terminal cleavage/methylation domain-containing protein [Phycisphaera sp.]|nr:prepilin-type N-terminal cleavage/methylation domain-containing protein [Phycisphaera sp.]
MTDMRNNNTNVRFAPARRRAFTIVELLVVMSIIVLLISILLPSLREAKVTSRRAVCLSQTHQIYLCWADYLNDNFQILFDYTLQQPNATRKIWTGTLAPYITEAGSDILICPETENPPGLEGVKNGYRMGNAHLAWVERRSAYHGVEPFDRASYTYNVNMCPRCQYGKSEDRNRTISSMEQANLVPVLGDGIWREAHPGEAGDIKMHPFDLSDPQAGATGAWDLAFRYATNRHGILTNLVFADGHSGQVYIPELWQLKWHRNYDTGAPLNNLP